MANDINETFKNSVRSTILPIVENLRRKRDEKTKSRKTHELAALKDKVEEDRLDQEIKGLEAKIF